MCSGPNFSGSKRPCRSRWLTRCGLSSRRGLARCVVHHAIRPPTSRTLQARGLLDISKHEDRMRAAIESFERALQLDPDYAMAHAGLATALAWFSVRYATRRTRSNGAGGPRSGPTRALKLDPELAEAHLAIASAAGTLYGHFNWHTRAGGSGRRASTIDPTLDLAFGVRGRARCITSVCSRRECGRGEAIVAQPGGERAETHPDRVDALQRPLRRSSRARRGDDEGIRTP